MRIVVSLIIFFLFFIFNFFKKEKFQCKSRCAHLDKSNCLSMLNIFTDRKCIWNNELGKCYDYKEGILNYGKTLPVTATGTTATGTTATGTTFLEKIIECSGHYGLNGEEQKKQSPKFKWFCKSCDCKDLNDAIRRTSSTTGRTGRTSSTTGTTGRTSSTTGTTGRTSSTTGTTGRTSSTTGTTGRTSSTTGTTGRTSSTTGTTGRTSSTTGTTGRTSSTTGTTATTSKICKDFTQKGEFEHEQSYQDELYVDNIEIMTKCKKFCNDNDWCNALSVNFDYSICRFYNNINQKTKPVNNSQYFEKCN